LARNSKGNDLNREKCPPVHYLYPPTRLPILNEDSFSILEGEINHFQAQGHVLVCGDLNARTGQEPDTLSTQRDKHLPAGDSIPSTICHPRHNYDNITNNNGSQLLQLCRTLVMYVVMYVVTDFNPESLRVFSQPTDTPIRPQQNHSLLEQSNTQS
jgi:hypothetical protein